MELIMVGLQIFKNKNWGAQNERRELIEFNIKHVTLHSVVYDEEYDICWYSTSDAKMTFMTTKFGWKITFVIGKF